MKPASCMGIAAIALMSSIGIAAAADSSMTSGSMSKSTSMQTSSKPADNLSLTKTQEHTIWQDVSKQKFAAKAPAGFNPKVGAKVPSTVPLMGMPSKAAQAVPTIKSDDYTTAHGKLLIVNPTSRQIVDVIAG